MNTKSDRLLRARRSFWLGIVSLLLVTGASSCGAQTAAESTETGNPPLIASDEIFVERRDDAQVEVTGSRDAVSPGGAPIAITNQATGETVTVDARDDGSFSAVLAGSPSDVYSVEVRLGNDTASASIVSGAAEAAVCEKICAGPSECGAREPLFPIAGCDCDHGLCECTHEECVEACLDDMATYRDKGTSCSEILGEVQSCISEAPCELFATRDEAALEAIPSCERARAFGDVCGFGAWGSCDVSRTEGSRTASRQLAECELAAACDGTTYGIECQLSSDPEVGYECSCRLDGVSRGAFESATPCAFPGPRADWVDDSELEYLAFRCGFEPSSPEQRLQNCSEPDFSENDGNPAECAIATSCDDVAYAVECTQAKEGISCSCFIDGAPVAQRLLDADGCAGGRRHDGSEPEPVQVMSAICGF